MPLLPLNLSGDIVVATILSFLFDNESDNVINLINHSDSTRSISVHICVFKQLL